LAARLRPDPTPWPRNRAKGKEGKREMREERKRDGDKRGGRGMG